MLKRIFLSLIVSFGFSDIAQARIAPHSASRRAAVPTLNVETGCKEAAALYHNTTINYTSCMADERAARTQLEKVWAKFSADARTQCIYLVTEPAIPSYVTLQGCLELARDAKNVSGSTGATASPATR
jgi:uncharacterized protein YifE (UPF0438 family)